MITVPIPKDIHCLITLEQLKREILNQTNENTLTPGVKEALEKAKRFFIDSAVKIENSSGNGIDYMPDYWSVTSSTNKIFSMEPGYYLEVDGVVHLLVPEFEN